MTFQQVENIQIIFGKIQSSGKEDFVKESAVCLHMFFTDENYK